MTAPATTKGRKPAAPAGPPKQATTEIGYVNGLGTDWAVWDRFEQVPDLQWPRSVEIYTRMSREDSRIASVINAIMLPIRQTQWRIEKAGASDEVTQFIAENLSLPVAGDDTVQQIPRTGNRFQWTRHLQEALSMLVFGHSFFETIYRINESDGRYWLAKLSARPQSSIMRIMTGLDGELIDIMQYSPATMGFMGFMAAPPLEASDMTAIPANKLVAYVREPTPGVWTGNSLLRPAYKHWVLKDELLRIQAAVARRNGMGVPVATAPDGVTEDEDVLKYQQIASAYQGGNHAGVGLPFGAKMQLLGVQGNMPDLQQAIEYHDKQIALAGLAHFLNLDKGGSYALASVQADTFTQAVQAIAETVRDTAQQQVVESLVDVNFGEDEPAPMLVLDEIGSMQDATAAALQMLVAAGILVPDPRLEAYERQVLGLPAADPDEDDDEPDPEPAETDPPETAIPVVPEIAVPENKYRSRRVRSRRITVEPNGALTLW